MRVRAAGVNPVDAYIRTGTYARKPPLPYTPGQDGAGEVESVGADVKEFKPGDRVYICGVGNTVAGAGHVRRARAVHPVAAASPAGARVVRRRARRSACRTARRTARCFSARTRGRARPSSSTARPAASASRAVELAHARGLTVIGSGGTDAGLDAVREHGADVVVNHRTPGYTDEIMKATGGKGVDLIVEMAAHVNLDRDLALLAKHGRVVVVGNRGEDGDRRAAGDGPRRGDPRHDAVQRRPRRSSWRSTRRSSPASRTAR